MKLTKSTALAGLVTAALAANFLLAGCASKSAAPTPENSAKVAQSATPSTSASASSPSPAKPSASILDYYVSLLGMSKDEIIAEMKEQPTTVDEGGLEFKNSGIRVWFEGAENRIVSQVYTARKDIDFKGAKIGDKVDAFKNAFGAPLSDKNGDMHFKYGTAFISVVYDTNSGNTIAVYVLKNDF